MSNVVNALVRGSAELSYPVGNPTPQPITINPRGDLSVVMGLPERSELVRLGNSWGAQIPTASAFTFVAAWPTTRAELVVSNGNAAGGKVYIIDRVWMINITSQAAAQPFSILAQIAPVARGIVAAADNPAVLRQQLSGNLAGGASGSSARLALANTAFALANQWFPVGSGAISPMTTNLGASAEAFVYGRYIVPPGAAFCIAGLAGTAAGTAICGVEWHEWQPATNAVS